MNSRLFLTAFFAISTQAGATVSCPNIGGTWTGSCHVGASKIPDAVKDFKPLTQKQSTDLEIIQLPEGHPLHCGLLVVGGDTIGLGGLQNESMSVVSEDGTPISLSKTSGASWDLANSALKTKTVGLVQIGSVQPSGFQSNGRFSLQADGGLVYEIAVKGDGFEIEGSCTYQRK